MMYEYIIKLESKELVVIEWYVYSKEGMHDALIFIIDNLMEKGDIIIIERSVLNESL